MLHSHMLHCIAAYAASNTTTCPSGGEPGDLHDCCISADMDGGGGERRSRRGEWRKGGGNGSKGERAGKEVRGEESVIRQSLLEDIRRVVLSCSHEKGTEIVVLRIKKVGWERSWEPGLFLTSSQLTTKWTWDCQIWKATETVWHGHPLIWSERGAEGGFSYLSYSAIQQTLLMEYTDPLWRWKSKGGKNMLNRT